MWSKCKRILCIRADNMGDVIMTTPALRALKETLGAHITLLTSSMAHRIVPFIPVIDDVIVADLPWVKANDTLDAAGIQQLIEQLKQGRFDAVVIFSVYSQCVLPAAMLAMQAGIPLRLAYCRENPYTLLTDWLPDAEPYRFIQHQVERDLKLVQHIGADTSDEHLLLEVDNNQLLSARQKLEAAGIVWPERFIVLHPGVSEIKRQYPVALWKEIVRQLGGQSLPLFVTGTGKERALAQQLCDAGQEGTIFNTSGLLDVGEFIALIKAACVVLSVNTATVHIAAAAQTPVVVLYALTNPQHTPWKVRHTVFDYSVGDSSRSRNEIVAYVHDNLFRQHVPYPLPEEVSAALRTYC